MERWPGQLAVAATGTLAWVPGPVVPYADATLVTVDPRGQVTRLPPVITHINLIPNWLEELKAKVPTGQ